jgi:hypothetical protein
MKVIFFILFGFFLALEARAQQYTLIGTVSVDKDKAYTYRIVFSDSAGIIKGYSVTDIKGADETKAAISGTLSTSKKELSFRETKLLNTRSSAEKDSFCFITASTKLVKQKGSLAFKGKFTGYKSDRKSECAKGEIILFSTEEVLNTLMNIAPKVDSPKSTPLNMIPLADGNSFTAICEDRSATIEVWDDKVVDGDAVSIFLNNKPVLENYTLDSNAKRINIERITATDTIKVVSVSEGKEPPNTAKLKLTSGSAVYYFKAKITADKPITIILQKK